MLRAQTAEVYRHEVKYFIDARDAYLLQSYLKSTMRPDENGGADGAYWVRSLYFDTAGNRDYYEKLGGFSQRRKLRVRIYDTQSPTARLEIKNKSGAYVHKQSLEIGRADAMRLAGGEFGFLAGLGGGAAEAFYAHSLTGWLRPVVLIDYTRKAFCLPFESIRVTIDSALRASRDPRGLFKDDALAAPVIAGDRRILEVKYDRMLPRYLRDALSNIAPQSSAISKYAMSRQAIHV